MADLNDINSAQSVKIIGNDSSGVEQTPVTSTANGNLAVADISNNGGVQGFITVGITAVQAMVGIAPLSNRKNLTVYNNGALPIYWGYNNTVSILTGTPLERQQFMSLDIGPNTNLYLIAGNTSVNVRITENA